MKQSKRNGDTLFRVGENCCAVARAERVAMLVDGERYFAAFMHAAERAQRSIIILAWDFDSRTPLAFDDDNRPHPAIGEFLNGLARRRRRLQIHILDWDYPMVFGVDREFPPLYGLSWTPHRHVHFRYDNTHPVGGSHHQKIVVIDDKVAFVGGLDLTCKRWDTRDHHPQDPRRIAAGKPYPPFHDAMIMLDGEAARRIAGIARERWHNATHEMLKPVNAEGDPWPDSVEPDLREVDVGIACTSPARERDPGVRNIEQLYLDTIERARRYIYIENQYFTAQKIGDALARRLAEPDGPEVVVVTRLLSHGWLEEATMHVLRTRLIRELRTADKYERFQVYYPHVEELAEGTCVDVHSKLMIVDDEWLRIGSSNISNRSMGMDTECDVVVEAKGQAEIARRIRRFRDELISEHVGVPVAEVSRMIDERDMNTAIADMRTPIRCLRPLEEVTEWSDSVLSTVSLADPERPVSLEMLVEQFAPDVEVHKAKPIWKMIVAVAVVLLGLALAWRYTPLADLVTADTARQWAESFSSYWWAPLLILLAYTPASLIMFPRPIITLAAVVAFGPWAGFGYAMGGILIAASTHYLAGRLLKRDTVRRMAGERLNRMTYALRKYGLLAVTAIRLIPVAPFAVEGVVVGAIHIKYWHFLLGTFLGMLPGVLTATVFADQLQAALDDTSKINYWLVAAVAILFLCVFLVVRRWFNKASAEHDTSSAASPSRRAAAQSGSLNAATRAAFHPGGRRHTG